MSVANMKDDLSESLILGLDLSTQSLKVISISYETGSIFTSHSIQFDVDLPQYKTVGGVHRNDETVTSPTAMFAHALELIFTKMKQNQFPFQKVVAISASGQQHGSVFFNNEAKSVFKSCIKEYSTGTSDPLEDIVERVLSIKDSPVWMDSSTTKECELIESAVGSALKLSQITGSRAYERYTGAQIAKIAKYSPELYENTQRIMLISSLIPTLLLGEFAPVDVADASGTLLMPLRAQPPEWSPELVQATAAPNLIQRLGQNPCLSYSVLGEVGLRWKVNFGLDAKVVSASGDNPNSAAGLMMRPGELAVSLGTSDTAFGLASNASPTLCAHVYRSPLAPLEYLPLVCYSNGSLTREAVKDSDDLSDENASWTMFEDAVAETAPGNGGVLGLFYVVPEIVPRLSAMNNAASNPIWIDVYTGFPIERADEPMPTPKYNARCRAVLESRCIAIRVHTQQLGLVAERVLLTGGGSRSQSFAQILADVLQVNVYRAAEEAALNSAAVGAALRAKHALVCEQQSKFIDFLDAIAPCAPKHELIASPNSRNAKIYDKMTKTYTQIESQLPKLINQPR